MSGAHSRHPLPSLFGIALATVLVASCGGDGGGGGDGREQVGMAAAGTVPLYDDLGDHHRAIISSSDDIQAFFDQGLRLQYAFNHAEAIRSYEHALELDPGCAMCWWGLALAAGPNINGPMSDEDGRIAYEAIGRAQELAAGAPPPDQALIEALAARYGADPALDRVALDSAYASGMAALVESYPDDPDVLTLYAASLMNLSAWNYWAGDYDSRTPNPGTEEILAALETALALNPDHPGACHYFIHAVEAAYPERAVACADRLASLMPGAGHIVHMPGHIYIRVGRYADAVAANEHAVHEDETYIQDQGISSIYTGAYYPHNYHFMAFAATMAGMSGKALEAGRVVSPKVPLEVAREVYWIQNAVVLPHLTLLTFGRWQEVLEEPLPPEELEHAMLMARYARGTAFAALGRADEANAVLEAVGGLTADAGNDPNANPVPHITNHVLAGEIALRTGNVEEAVVHFAAAVEIEDGMLYEEPPLWYYPIRHSLGRALLEAGRSAEAEQVYRRDLERFPENGWSLFGLATALDAQGETTQARAMWLRFEAAWAGADVMLSASRF